MADLSTKTKENDMQDHAYETRQQYINDYAARVKLPAEEQRALWMSHLRATKHPRIEQQTRSVPCKVMAGSNSIQYMGARLEQERAIRDEIRRLNQDLVSRKAWKEI